MDRIVDLTVRAMTQRLPRKIDLAREYGVHPRTINRALAAIERRVPVRCASDAQTARARGEAIAAHCLSDLRITRALAEKMGVDQ
jgi:DNA-binding transcriptional regulator YhcF (GntR family)